jgi:sulfite reductase (NADPH) hemoprotein beta-component
VAQADVASTIERIVEVYRAAREDGERFIETYRRIGMRPFKESAYATHSKAA